jgi:hypothetical protein
MSVNYAPPPQAGALPNFGASVKPPEPPKEEKKEPKPFPEEIDYRKIKLIGIIAIGEKHSMFLYEGQQYKSWDLLPFGHEIEYVNGRSVKLNGHVLRLASLPPSLPSGHDFMNPIGSLPTVPSVRVVTKSIKDINIM